MQIPEERQSSNSGMLEFILNLEWTWMEGSVGFPISQEDPKSRNPTWIPLLF